MTLQVAHVLKKRRWYDSIMPFQPPWDNRPTVGEAGGMLSVKRLLISYFRCVSGWKRRPTMLPQAYPSTAALLLAVRAGMSWHIMARRDAEAWRKERKARATVPS